MPMLVNKLTALVLILLGFLVLAYNYRGDSVSGMIGGLVLLAVGIVLLVLKIAARNRSSHSG